MQTSKYCRKPLEVLGILQAFHLSPPVRELHGVGQNKQGRRYLGNISRWKEQPSVSDSGKELMRVLNQHLSVSVMESDNKNWILG